MFRTRLYVVLCSWFLLSLHLSPQSNSESLYLSSTTLLNYQKMIKTFRIFVYDHQPNEAQFQNPVESLFYSSLKNSTFLTPNPQEAHLYFLPFSTGISTRSLARVISRVRTRHPYWNRTLGADHFFLSCPGIGWKSDRNLVELKKNAIQLSCFPTRRENFVPHKDLTLPPLHAPHSPHAPDVTPHPLRVPGNPLVNHPERATTDLYYENDGVSNEEHVEFCVLEYGNDVSSIGEALRLGCVPVVVSEGPINDMPFMDVLRWSEMAVFVKNGEGVKRVLGGDTWRERREYMRGLGVVASKHFMWNRPPMPLDAFNTVMYQLWLRRHTIRYMSMQEDLNLLSHITSS